MYSHREAIPESDLPGEMLAAVIEVIHGHTAHQHGLSPHLNHVRQRCLRRSLRTALPGPLQEARTAGESQPFTLADSSFAPDAIVNTKLRLMR
jgi:hypothetical protein